MTEGTRIPQAETTPQSGAQIAKKLETECSLDAGDVCTALVKADALAPVYFQNPSVVAGAFTWDTLVAKTQLIFVTEDTVITINNAQSDDGIESTLMILQDSTGGHAVTFAGQIDFEGGSQPTIGTTANKVNMVRGVGYGGSQFAAFVAGINMEDFI